MESLLECLMEDNTKLEDQLRCEGYYGFGTGWEMATRGAANADAGGEDVVVGGPGYCNGCSLAQTCWVKHKERVAKLLPGLTESFEDMAKQYPGKELMNRWFKAYHIADPYSVVMAGNVQDGSWTAIDGKPRDRGAFSLPWPFNQIA